MSTFTVRDGKFWLDDKPVLIQAGEFHYYRTPREEWRNRLELLKGAGFNAVASYMPWIWHQLEEDNTDLDGHSHPMRDLAGFLDLAAEMGLLILARPGPYIMAETINEGIPPWVLSKYSQTAFISQDGKAQNVVSYLHPDFLRCVDKWYKAIFQVLTPRQITQGGKIIMVQLDNEMGMIQWVRNILDTNPDTIARFAAYLKNEYGEKLAERYPALRLEEFLLDEIVKPSQPYGATVVEDYRRFYREYLGEYAQLLLSEAKANGLEVPAVINIHGFANGGKTFPIGISQLIKAMDIPGMISATDVYPGIIGEGNIHELLLVNEMTRAVQNREQGLFSIEFQSGGVNDFSNGQTSLFDLHTRLVVSAGMRAINHYLFCDGENDPVLSPTKRHDWGHPVRKDGSLRRHYHRYPRLSAVLNTYGKDLVVAKPKTVTTIGYLLDYYMTEVNTAASKPAADVITHQRDVVLFDMIGRGLTLTQRPFEVVELTRAALDVQQTPLLWVMLEKQCEAGTQQKLADYVQQGGKLVLAGRIPEENFAHQPCTILKEALGIQEICSDAPFIHKNIRAFHYVDIPVSFVETYQGSFEEVFATDEQGGTVGFITRVGKGKALVYGAAMTANTLDDLDVVNQMAKRMDLPPLFEMSDWLDVRVSEGERGDFLFINNYQDDPIEARLSQQGKALFGGQAVRLAARSGLILPVEWQYNENVTIHYATSEITEINQAGARIEIKLAQDECEAEMILSGYACDPAIVVGSAEQGQRVKVHPLHGKIGLTRLGGGVT